MQVKTWTRFILSILFFAVALPALGEGTGRYWVEFSDKGRWELLDPSALRAAATEYGLTDAALQRRRVEGIADADLVTVSDLPPDPTYLSAITAAGATIHQVSRWFNLASVSAGPEALERICELPFVQSVKPVGVLMPAHSEYEIVGTFDGMPAPGPGIDAAGSYGPSYRQALQVNAVEAHRLGYTGRGVLMAVIDGGFTLDHEAFCRIDVVATYDVTDNETVVSQEAKDAPGQTAHGTLCLSTIAGYAPGNLIGTAYEASFLLVKSEYIPTETVQEEDDYVTGLEWAERLGVRVTSSSLGYTDWYNAALTDGEYPITSRALNRARELGVVCVTSAGNEGPQPHTIGSPGDSWGGLSIGAVDSLGEIAGFSSRGPTSDDRTKPDLVGRGVRCIAVAPFSDHRYIMANGTSLSTPVVAGVAALVRGAHPDWSAEKVIRALKSTADRSDRPDNVYGWGTPDAVAAIRYPELRMIFETPDREAVHGVAVTLSGPDGAQLSSASGRRGVVSFANLPEGNWKYKAKLPDGLIMLAGDISDSLDIVDGKTLRFQVGAASKR